MIALYIVIVLALAYVVTLLVKRGFSMWNQARERRYQRDQAITDATLAALNSNNADHIDAMLNVGNIDPRLRDALETKRADVLIRQHGDERRRIARDLGCFDSDECLAGEKHKRKTFV